MLALLICLRLRVMDVWLPPNAGALVHARSSSGREVKAYLIIMIHTEVCALAAHTVVTFIIIDH